MTEVGKMMYLILLFIGQLLQATTYLQTSAFRHPTPHNNQAIATHYDNLTLQCYGL